MKVTIFDFNRDLADFVFRFGRSQPVTAQDLGRVANRNVIVLKLSHWTPPGLSWIQAGHEVADLRDVALSRPHARATAEEVAFLKARGDVSERVTLRTMARTPDGNEQALVELKAVDAAYPMVGAVELNGGLSFSKDVFGKDGLAVGPILLDRLKLKIGDTVRIGEARLPIVATIKKEPDGLTDRLTYGPRILLSLSALEKTKLVQPGTLVRWRYAVRFPDQDRVGPETLVTFRDALTEALPESGFAIVDRRNPSPRVTRTLDRLRQFLTLLGLTALLVGGVGVANAVATFVDRRRKVIATMKSIGATQNQVFTVFGVQIFLIAAVGVLIGLLAGYLVPFGLVTLLAEDLPIAARLSPTLATIVTASTYGFLVAFLFAIWPLARAGGIRPSVLFRDQVSDERARASRSALVLTGLVGAALVAFAMIMSDARFIVLYFCLGVSVVFVVFQILGAVITKAARAAPRLRPPELALAVGNLGMPGGMTRTVVLSLGLGLSLLVSVALMDFSLVRELTGRMPADAPNYFVLDITSKDLPPFQRLVKDQAQDADIRSAPMLRGRLVKLNDKPVTEIKAAPEAEWVLRGDRGLSFAEEVPAGSKVVAGQWWPNAYQGEPLVSFEADLAKGLGVAVGDTVTVNVLGRNVTARISNLREVQWESLELNFVMVFSPNTLQGAPHAYLATVTLPNEASLKAEADLARAIGKAFPNQTVIRVKDAINAFNTVFAKVMTAVRAAGLVTLLAGALVLAGAFATAQRRRSLEAVILKTLGATRARITKIHLAEYAVLAAVTAFAAVLIGALAAYLSVTLVMKIDFSFSWVPVVQALVLASALILVFGGLNTWSILRVKSASYLKSE